MYFYISFENKDQIFTIHHWILFTIQIKEILIHDLTTITGTNSLNWGQNMYNFLKVKFLTFLVFMAVNIFRKCFFLSYGIIFWKSISFVILLSHFVCASSFLLLHSVWALSGWWTCSIVSLVCSSVTPFQAFLFI